MLLRDLLNRIVWDPREDRENYEILFVHRGVNGNVRRISMSDIVRVTKSWFIYLDSGSEQPIPLHRVLRVVNLKTRKVLWSKS